MAQIKLGIGMSHTPRIVIPPEDWHYFPSFAASMGGFVDVDGEMISGAALIEKYGGQFAAQATLAAWQASYRVAQESLERLKTAVLDHNIDLIIVIGDDQHELLTRSNYPSLLVFTGEQFKMANRYARAAKQGSNPFPPAVVDKMAAGFFMDANPLYPSHAPLARQIVADLLTAGMTPAVADDNVADPALGFGHAFGVIIKTLLADNRLPLLPIVVNNYFPPNQPTPQLCWRLGEVIKTAVSALPDPLNIAIVASGGLSHFVVNETWDRHILTLMRDGDPQQIQAISPNQLRSGNSEVMNWITVAAACQHLQVQWDSYAPVYAQPHREGVGLAFMAWAEG